MTRRSRSSSSAVPLPTPRGSGDGWEPCKSLIGKAHERPDVQGLKPGDRVASNGPHAGVVCVPKHPCARVPDKVPYEHAAFTVVGAIALQGVRLAHLHLGETAFVVGLGLVGQITVDLAAILAVRSLREGVPFEIM